MTMLNVRISSDKVEIKNTTLGLEILIEELEESDILADLPLEAVLNFYSPQQIIDHIGVQELIKLIGEEKVLDSIGQSKAMYHFGLSEKNMFNKP